MDKIGFKNFRKFTNFPEIDLGGVTILVGGNNAGKSTLVKAMLLMRDFILSKVTNTNMIPEFSFDTEHVSIGNFRRAFCRNSDTKEDTITFTLGIGNFVIRVNVKGDRESDMQSKVANIKISDTDNNVDFIIDYNVHRMSVRFGISGKNEERAVELENKKMEFEFLNEELKKTKNLEEITLIKDKLNIINTALKSLKENPIEKEEIVSFDIPEGSYDDSGWHLLPELIYEFAYYATSATMGDKRSANYKREEAKKVSLKARTPLIEEISRSLEHTLQHISVEYIFAHSVSQQVFYNREKDYNDYVTKTIHEFYQSKISEGGDEYAFIKKWMDIFEIGHAIEIRSYEGEAYRVIIYNEDNENGIDLADMGMGSIQIIILLLRVATLVRRYEKINLTILLEEPEQNLHPALQSKLAELLYEINQLFGFQIIVETHSEYLVRNSQVLVAKYHDTDETAYKNPFKLYYMPQRDLPYSIGYTLSGRLTDKFESGFFDEAGKSNFYIMRKERGIE